MTVEIPESWINCEIGEVTKIVGGATPPSKDPTNFTSVGGTPWITPADLSKYKSAFVECGNRNLTDKGYKACSATKIPAGSVLFSSRAPIGYVAIASTEITTNQGFKSFVLPAELDGRYVYYFLRHIKSVAEMMATGTTFKELSGSATAKLPFILAPRNEQKRIADKLDTLLMKVDACRNRLDRMPRILKRFRQAVLAAATSGALTEDWRDKNSKSNKPWCKTTLVNVCQKTRVITYGVIKLGNEVANGIPCLRTSNVRWLHIDTDGMKRIATSLSDDYSRTILRGDEVLINVRGTLGGVAVVPNEMAGWNVSREVAVVPTDTKKINPHFLAFWIGSDKSQRWLSGVEKGVAYTGINIEDLRALPVEIPSSDEQIEIILRVDKLFAYIDRIEARYNTARKQVDQLTPSLLAKAFRGELVEQDPNDEPASVLLERIKTERGSTPTRKRASSAKVRK